MWIAMSCGCWLDIGVTRISLGAQSFSRRQNCACWSATIRQADIYRAAKLVREAGMHVALDLIFGVPGETPAAWQADLDAALVHRAGPRFHLWPDVRARHHVLEPAVAWPAGPARR